MDTCKQNIQDFLDRKIGGWTGLRSDCQKSEILTWWPFNPGEGNAQLGERHIPYVFHVLQLTNFTRGVFFYFQENNLCCIATEFWSFDQEECAKVLREAGQPSQRLDFFWRDEEINAGEWVYPDRGIAFGVIPATGLLAWLLVYPPCPIETYRERYYNTQHTREFRKRT